MGDEFVCPRCGNSDIRFIGHLNGRPYCRLCLPYCGKEAFYEYRPHKGIRLELSYPLSEKQEKIASKTRELISEGKNILIHAVTGAGKTELVYYSMEMILENRGHVGFATPRRDVVIDLTPRIKEAFPKAKVVSVYGDHSSVIEGDIIVLTTHQLYRYPSYFDLLILDEIDAFPYCGNLLLKSFFRRSIRGNYVLLSATPSQEDIDEVKRDNGCILTLFERYHKAPLPLPEYIRVGYYSSYFVCLKRLSNFIRENKPVFVFAPTIEIGKKLFFFLSLFLKNGNFVSSKEEERKLNIERFKAGQLDYLVTTSILERGVTVRNLQVIVFEADHLLFQQRTLVQIAGRAGRKIDATDGKVLLLAEEESESIKGAIDEIKKYNQGNSLL